MCMGGSTPAPAPVTQPTTAAPPPEETPLRPVTNKNAKTTNKARGTKSLQIVLKAPGINIPGQGASGLSIPS